MHVLFRIPPISVGAAIEVTASQACMQKRVTRQWVQCVDSLKILGADFWAGGPTKHFSVRVFSEKGGGIQ